jgi:hypothetical protein
MKWQSGLLFCAWAVLSPAAITPAAAKERHDIQELHDWGKETNHDHPYSAYCVGGVAYLMKRLKITTVMLGSDHPAAMCGDPTRGASVQAFINWAEKHPELWEQPNVDGVILALKET